ncbi:MAG: hypothetical protein CMD67_02020 [Gammaproteobacteria bacterium]|jgi:TPR repeat protein|nr:hypothetical protein [Gammaproteobacteria bacterium]|tara:strand:- start:1590 stop:2177 length:588 start_codon:yes stop_codon:yes gene_type:complete
MRKLLVTLAIAVALLLGTGSARADFDDANKAYQRGDFTTALKMYKPLAEQGIARAQTSLGVMYLRGDGVPKDYSEALKWFRLAAEQGEAFAQYSLGNIYAEGLGVPKNGTEAVKWYLLAAEQGLMRAMRNLAGIYVTGQGTPVNYIKGYMWSALAKAKGWKESSEAFQWLEAKMTESEIAQAQQLAAEWWKKYNN